MDSILEWIKMILPLIGVLLGWLLAESGKIFSDKRQDKRKLKKLLFFLLELRYHFAKDLSIHVDLDKYINKLKEKISHKLGVDHNGPALTSEIDSCKPFLINLISQSKYQDDQFDHLNGNIDNILNELAEVFPILAYELNGQHNIKERLNRANHYFNEINKMTNEFPIDIKELITPKLTKDLLDGLDESIEKIAQKIDKNTLLDAKLKISKMNFQNNDTDVDKIIDEYLEKMSENLK